MNCKDCKYIKLLKTAEQSKDEYKAMYKAALEKIGELQDKIRELLSS